MILNANAALRIPVGSTNSLQFDVLEERLRAENGLDVMFEQSPYQAARWISADDSVSSSMIERHAQSGELDLDLDGNGGINVRHDGLLV